MDRDEFMELVYETFADEPDNVLANGIIEAADAYAEHEKAQLSHEGATSDLISRMETVEHLRRVLEATVPNTDYDEGFVDGVEFGVSTVSTMPTIQPVATDTNVGNNSEIPNSSDTISRQAAIDALDCINGVEEVLRSLPSVQPEPQEGHWILYDKRFPWRTWYKCSECGNYLDFSGVNGGRGEVNFCPNCGADMRGKQHETD